MSNLKPLMTIVLLLLTTVSRPEVVTAQSPLPDRSAPVPFNGMIGSGPCRGVPAVLADGVSQARGTTCETPVLEMSDPRLGGEATLSINSDTYPDGTVLYSTAFRIENADGVWQEVPSVRIGFPDGTYSTPTIILVGEGGYDGMTAIAEAPLVGDVWSLDGYIVASQELPRPDPAPGLGTGVSAGSDFGSPPPSSMLGPASWWLDPASVPVPDDATVLRGWIREMSCASGTSPEERLLAPSVDYGPAAIVVRFDVHRMLEADCPGNPAYQVEVRLAESVDGRALLDGSVSPPRDATHGDPDARWPYQPAPPSLAPIPLILVTESPVEGGGPVRHCLAIGAWWGPSPVISVWTTREFEGCATRSSSIWTPSDVEFDAVTGALRYRFDLIPDGVGISELGFARRGGRMMLVEPDGREVGLRPASNLRITEG